jgi:uncharacterized metal-binding protein YceD (DUF177 family)
MRGSLIRHVDPWQDAARGARYEAHVGADRLPRLCALGRVEEPLRVVMSFAFATANQGGARGGNLAGLRGAVEVELSVEGTIEVDCQRCLEPMTVELAVHSKVWVVRDETTARASESSAEAIVSAPGEHLELAALVEDETLLGMPFAPCHPADECELHAHAVQAMAGEIAQQGAEKEWSGGQDNGRGLRTNMNVNVNAQFGLKTEGRELDVNAAPVSAQGNEEVAGAEARPNPFAVLARLRDGGEIKD